MRVGVLCEFSGRVRDAFIRRGHDAVSCDVLPSEAPGAHRLGDCLSFDWSGFDLPICFPPCTHLAVSGARYFAQKRADGRQADAIRFVMRLATLPCPRIAIENAVGVLSTLWRKPDQIIQPYQFGHPESKRTCLWLKGIPNLVPTQIVEPTWFKNPDGSDYRDAKGKRYSPTHYLMGRGQVARWQNQTPSGQNGVPGGRHQARIRSLTYPGIADAMADQWGNL